MADFAKTDYQLLNDIRNPNPDSQGQPSGRWGKAFTRFSEGYRDQLIEHVTGELRRRRYPAHQVERAEDLVSEYLSNECIKLLAPTPSSPSVFTRYRREGGKSFHGYLKNGCWLSVLSRVTTELREKHGDTRRRDDPAAMPAKRRGTGNRPGYANAKAEPSGDSCQAEPWATEPAWTEADPQRQHERSWGLVLLGEALAIWKAERLRQGDSRRWRLFWDRHMEPIVSGTKRPTVREICEDLGYDKPFQAANAEDTMRDQIEEALRAALSRRLDKEAERLQRPVADDWEARKALVIDAELEDFFALMTREVHERNRRCEQRCGEYRDLATDGESPNDDRDSETGSLSSTDTPLVDRGALQRYFDRLVGEASDETPGLSRETTGLPDLTYCSLYDIALLLSDDRQACETANLADQFEDYLRLPVRQGIKLARRRQPLEASLLEAKRADDPVAEFLFAVQPDRDVLIGLKETTKALRASADSDFSNAVLTAVYYLCAASALIACGDKIVDLPDSRLAENLSWLAERPWVDPQTREQAQLGIATSQRPNPMPAEPVRGDVCEQVA